MAPDDRRIPYKGQGAVTHIATRILFSIHRLTCTSNELENYFEHPMPKLFDLKTSFLDINIKYL